MSNKNFRVLDTSVLLYSASSLYSFGNGTVVIPYAVLEELDRFKNRDDVVGSNARQVARELNELRKISPLNKGVVLPSGGELRVELGLSDNLGLEIKENDDKILNVCLSLQKQNCSVVLITRDINLAVRADALGLSSETFDANKQLSSIDELYTGTGEVIVSGELIDAFYAGEKIYPADIEGTYFPNQYLTLISEGDASKTALCRYMSENHYLSKLRSVKSLWGIKPRNREQQFAIDALLDPNIKLLTMTGLAGCGKTLMAMAAALHLVQDEEVYTRLVVSRTIQPLGKDIGFLPGSLEEKILPWMAPIRDALDFLMQGKGRNRDLYSEMVGMGMLEVQPLTYIRGRSMPNMIFIVDESQDITKPEMKTLVSRMGENSKLILTGDVAQITNPYLDPTTSGLTNAIEKFKPYNFVAHVTMLHGERSELSTAASQVL